MRKSQIVFSVSISASVVLLFLYASPVLALNIGPIPIPGDLIPPPGNGLPLPTPPPLTETVPLQLPISPYTIQKTGSGLLKQDSLTDQTLNKEQLLANPGYWKYGGSAQVQNAPFDIYKDSQGFHIGVKALADTQWAGFYGVTPSTDGTLFHSVITTDRSTLPIPNVFYENGMYVQTAALSNVNYVTCTSDTSMFGTSWIVASATGNVNGITDFNLLWYDSSPNQPLTRDCTIITNGTNYLKVYLDGIKVYENSTLNLQMPGPFNAFLEPQTSYSGEMQYGTYKDYYATTTETVTVTNNPPLAATVKLVNPDGKVLASAPVVSGTASLTIGQYHMPLAAFIKVYDSNGIQIASTPNSISVFGGDTYSAKLNLNLGLL